ncbi:MAG: MGMT family protein [Vicinamibacteria bacterium]
MAKPNETERESPSSIVKALVHRIPTGRVASYGVIGRAAAAMARPIGGARTVAWILASLKRGDDTPWHRVVGAGGIILLPDDRGAKQRTRLHREGIHLVKGKVPAPCLIDENDLLADHPRSRRKRTKT